MERVEDRDAVQEDQVLVGRSAADVEGGAEVGDPRHAGQHLHALDRVGLRNAGNRLQFPAIQLLHRYTSGSLEPLAPPAPVALRQETGQLDGLFGQSDLHVQIGSRSQIHSLLVRGVPDVRHAQDIVTGRQIVEGEVAQPVGTGDLLSGRVNRWRQADGGVLDGDRDFGPHAAAQQPIRRREIAARPGDDDHLRPQFDVSEVRVGEEQVERPCQVQHRAVAVDAQVGREQTGAEGDLDVRPFGEPDEGLSERRPVD